MSILSETLTYFVNQRDRNIPELAMRCKIDRATLYQYLKGNRSFHNISPLHGAPTVYDTETDEKVCELNEEGYLTYITETGDYIIAQYITVDSYYYGVLMNNRCEVVAYLPYLSDVISGELYIDYPSGKIRKSQIYSIDEEIKMAQEVLTGGE